MSQKITHPAKFSDVFIPLLAELLKYKKSVLDPFAGTGKIAAIKEYGFAGKITCCEIEPEYANLCVYQVDKWYIGDSADMYWADDNSFDAICTSPTYGNRMADHFNATDSSRRLTYRHTLGRSLHSQNTGRMQWGDKYRDKHDKIYTECLRVLEPGGFFIVNISDHIRAGRIIPVTAWHKSALNKLGLIFVDKLEIKTQRMRFGENSNVRVNHESILIFRRQYTGE
jgi:DNA modification methylase